MSDIGYRSVAGAVVGATICYAFGAAVAWDFNPDHWSVFWRLWCTCWTLPWAFVGALLGAEL